ncbi:MAG: hypothetical protein HY648_06255, partial [Acidobacteria bacterium]|nr:hypothetical protein [Acidobacteriota bacterium]
MKMVLFGILVCLLGGWQALATAETPASPSVPALQTMGKALLEQKSPVQRRALEEFAEQNSDRQEGALAYLALGYEAFQGRRDADARKYFQAAAKSNFELRDYAEYYLALSQQDNHGA